MSIAEDLGFEREADQQNTFPGTTLENAIDPETLRAAQRILSGDGEIEIDPAHLGAKSVADIRSHLPALKPKAPAQIKLPPLGDPPSLPPRRSNNY